VPSGGTASRIFRFGAFVFDLAQRRLYEGGVELALNPKALDVLAYFVARPNYIVSKDELLREVWNTTVVTDDALVQRVLDVRKALRDDPKNPQFIRTHPKRGYEWIGGAQEATGFAEEEADAVVAAAPVTPWLQRHLWIRASLLLAGIQVLVAALLWTRKESTVQSAEFQVTRLTATPGMEDHPAPEPIGSGRVLFTANDGKALRLWLLDPKTGQREPFGEAAIHQSEADWSADGRQIAFRSSFSGGSILVQPIGGTAKRVSPFGHHPRWSFDGSRIVFQTEGPAGKIFVHNLQAGSNVEVLLSGPPLSNIAYPVLSKDGRTVYFLAIASAGAGIPGQVALGHQVWRVPVQGGVPELVTANIGIVRDGGFDLRQDGLEIVFVGLDRSLWTLPVDPKTGLGNGKARHLTLSTEEHQHPRYRVQGGIVFSTVASPDALWLIPFRNGKADASGMRRLTRDGMLARQAAVDRSGRRVAFISWGGERFEIWGLEIDTLRSWRISPPKGPSRVRPFWSHDGLAMVYVLLDGPYRTYQAAWLDESGQQVVREAKIPDPEFPLTNNGFIVKPDGTLERYGAPPPVLDVGSEKLAGLVPRFAQAIAGRPEIFFVAAFDGWFNLWKLNLAKMSRPERITSFEGGQFHMSDSNCDFGLHPQGVIVSIRQNRSDLWMIH